MSTSCSKQKASPFVTHLSRHLTDSLLSQHAFKRRAFPPPDRRCGWRRTLMGVDRFLVEWGPLCCIPLLVGARGPAPFALCAFALVQFSRDGPYHFGVDVGDHSKTMREYADMAKLLQDDIKDECDRQTSGKDANVGSLENKLDRITQKGKLDSQAGVWSTNALAKDWRFKVLHPDDFAEVKVRVDSVFQFTRVTVPDDLFDCFPKPEQ